MRNSLTLNSSFSYNSILNRSSRLDYGKGWREPVSLVTPEPQAGWAMPAYTPYMQCSQWGSLPFLKAYGGGRR